jgi:hypothetical protein
VTIDEQLQGLQDALKHLAGLKRKPWLTADEKRAVVEMTKTRLAEAERTLRLPERSDTAQARRQLILRHELGRGTLKTSEYH